MSKLLQLTAALLLLCTSLVAQSDSDILFTVGDREVTVGEFKYIYTKTNGDKADFSRASLKEYLDLYERFKLKVNRAYDMGLDTVKVLQQELAGYRRQLADNYLIDRAVTDQLVEELYDHMKMNVDISHILIAVKENATPADSLAAYQQITEIKKDLKVKDFGTKAGEVSQDRYTKDKGGRVGFLSAPFPKGMYALEKAVYAAPLNTIVGPVRTKFGYHLVVVNEKRPARGEVEAAHIMTRKPENGSPEAARKNIERAQMLLESGQPFEQVATAMSEDKKTAGNGGYIGFFGVKKYAKAFEDAAFNLTEDDTYTGIIETNVGFHIIRRISKKSMGSLEDERAPLTVKIKEDPRFEAATQALLTDIRRRNNFTENKQAFGAYTAKLVDSTFFTFQWNPIGEQSSTSLFSVGDKQVTIGDFEAYLKRNARPRVSRRRNGNSAVVARQLYNEFQDKELMAYAESQLENNYPEFRALMREYEEGILLFEATKIEVWDKASQDSAGLANFFADNRAEYKWNDRARVTLYTIYPNISDQAGDIRKMAMNSDAEAVLAAFASEGSPNKGLIAKTDFYEKGRIPRLEDLPWQAGVTTKLDRNNQNGRFTFYKIEEVLGSSQKELNEARGYVIADYQDQLERNWVDQLRKEYPVKVRKKIFEKLVRK